MMSNRLIIISNRLPFKIHEKKGMLEFTNSSGGLVSSIRSYVQRTDERKNDLKPAPVWIGTSDIPEKKLQVHLADSGLRYDGFDLIPVFIPSGINDKFYNGFCNDTIWPLFHYFPSYAKFEDDHYTTYVKANELFCSKILEIYRPGDTL